MNCIYVHSKNDKRTNMKNIINRKVDVEILTAMFALGSSTSHMVVSNSKLMQLNPTTHSPIIRSRRIRSQPYRRNLTPILFTSSGTYVRIDKTKVDNICFCMYSMNK